MKTFYQLLGNTLLVTTKNSFVWFALTFWIYLTTQSVISTSILGGTFMIVSALSSFWFGSIVDHNKKKNAMLVSGLATLALFTLGFIIYNSTPESAFESLSNPLLWVFVFVLLCGSVAGNIVGIAVPTLITLLVEADKRDKANGMFGTVMGISFAITSVASGMVIGFLGMGWALLIAVILSVVAVVHLFFIHIGEDKVLHIQEEDMPAPTSKLDIKGTIRAISSIPGLFALIFFTTFNNFLGGVFMALMDAYGLSLVSVQTWGTLFASLSFGFIFGGIYISKKGLGDNPLRNLFRISMVNWVVCILFTIQPSIVLFAVGALIWMSMVPFIEATEQTIIQKVVPAERQGRVFGFAHSIEQAAAPMTAFMIGPVAQYIFIPFMTTGKGVELIGDWFGVGVGRGIALVFIIAGFIGLIVTIFAKNSNAYKLLASKYRAA